MDRSGSQRQHFQAQAHGPYSRPLAEALGAAAYTSTDREEFWRRGPYTARRFFAELFGTFLLVLVAAGGNVVNVRFGGHVISQTALVVAPGLMVMCVILFMGTVSGAHLNPVVSIAFALRNDFAWKRVPLYVAAQLGGAALAMELLLLLLGKHGSVGLTLPGPGASTTLAMAWEIVLTAGLVSVILGTASGAQNIGWGAAIGVGGFISLAGLVGSPVSGASMNPARSIMPAILVGDYTAWWAYIAGPLLGALIAVGIAWILRGAGGGVAGRRAGSGTLGELWRPGPIVPAEEEGVPPQKRSRAHRGPSGGRSARE
ncbi:MAG: aquaporin [Actinobacteria bacterium]|nr:aquaporin [Actinomycetota bacterium]